MVREAPRSGSSCEISRIIQLTMLLGLDAAVTYIIYYATTVEFVRVNYSIAHATLTLNSTYKILGISGGPIAGRINGVREKILNVYTWTWRGYAIVAGLYYAAAVIEAISYSRLKVKTDYRRNIGAVICGIVYFLGWCGTFAVSASGAAVWYMDKNGVGFKGASFNLKRGTQVSAYAAALLVFIFAWRAAAKCLRSWGHDDGTGQPGDAESQLPYDPQALAAGITAAHQASASNPVPPWAAKPPQTVPLMQQTGGTMMQQPMPGMFMQPPGMFMQPPGMFMQHPGMAMMPPPSMAMAPPYAFPPHAPAFPAPALQPPLIAK